MNPVNNAQDPLIDTIQPKGTFSSIQTHARCILYNLKEEEQYRTK